MKKTIIVIKVKKKKIGNLAVSYAAYSPLKKEIYGYVRGRGCVVVLHYKKIKTIDRVNQSYEVTV